MILSNQGEMTMQTEYQKVLVAIDIYSEYNAVIERALTIVNSPLDLQVMYVSRPQVYFEPYGMAIPNDYSIDMQKQSNAKLIKIAEEYEIPESHTYTPVGAPAEEIHDFAQEIHADLIIIGTHGQSGLGLLLGSTANAVLHGVKRDVLAVRL